ncbi:MAG: SRPBCC family protein [Ilumatobacteraceae bacterium]
MTYGHRLVRVLRCNWKTYADNYLEGYHVPLIHPSLNRALEMSTYRADVPHDSYCIHRSDTATAHRRAARGLYR